MEGRMERARKYLYTRGPEHAMSFAIEDGKSPARSLVLSALLTFPSYPPLSPHSGQDLSVLRTLIGLGAKVWHTSWNVACYTGNFEVMKFLDSNGYWSEINTEAISCAIRAGQLEAAKWLRAHDPPAPWDMDVTNACVIGWAKAAGCPSGRKKMMIRTTSRRSTNPASAWICMGSSPKTCRNPYARRSQTGSWAKERRKRTDWHQ